MNTTQSVTPNASSATTTEELIVQYLDGELVRKELETVLFDRLFHSEDARTLLRDYLVMRGAIRVSREDARFQLSDNLDARTRARIEQILVTISTEEVPSGFLEDRRAISTTATSRSLKKWMLRPSIAALLLLLAVGTTWFVSRQTETPSHGDMAQALQSQTQMTPSSTQPAQSAKQTESTPPAMLPVKQTPSHHIMPSRIAPARVRTQSFAQNSASAQPGQPKAAERPASTDQAEDPSDVMIFPRFSKAINAAEKHEVVVSSHDRL